MNFSWRKKLCLFDGFFLLLCFWWGRVKTDFLLPSSLEFLHRKMLTLKYTQKFSTTFSNNGPPKTTLKWPYCVTNFKNGPKMFIGLKNLERNFKFSKILQIFTISIDFFFSIVTQKYSISENVLQSLVPNLDYFKDDILAKYQKYNFYLAE